DGVVADWHLPSDVGKSQRRTVRHLAAAIDQEMRSRKTAGINIPVLEMRIDAIERGLGHTDRFGRDRGWHRNVPPGRLCRGCDNRSYGSMPSGSRLARSDAKIAAVI